MLSSPTVSLVMLSCLLASCSAIIDVPPEYSGEGATGAKQESPPLTGSPPTSGASNAGADSAGSGGVEGPGGSSNAGLSGGDRGGSERVVCRAWRAL